jgi:hypothetical protein
MRAGEVIDKLAENAYFMRVDNKVLKLLLPELTNTKAQVAA